MSPLYGQTLGFGNAGANTVTLPNYATGGYGNAPDDGYFGIIACLSCHDGNLAKVAMMKGTYGRNRDDRRGEFQPPDASR